MTFAARAAFDVVTEHAEVLLDSIELLDEHDFNPELVELAHRDALNVLVRLAGMLLAEARPDCDA